MAQELSACLVILIAVIIVILFILIFKHIQKKDKFIPWAAPYTPACLYDRRRCHGWTKGTMPVIDDVHISWEPCCGSFGVPPPVGTH